VWLFYRIFIVQLWYSCFTLFHKCDMIYSGYIKERGLVLTPFQVVLINQRLDSLFDRIDLWHKMFLHLVNSSCLQLLVCHLFLSLHNANNRRVEIELSVVFDGGVCTPRFLGLWYVESADDRVQQKWQLTETFAWIELIWTLACASSKSALNLNTSELLTSLPCGSFLSTLFFAHAKLWRVLFNSSSSVIILSGSADCLVAFVFHDSLMFVCSLISLYEISVASLKISRITPWYKLTESSLIPGLNLAFKTMVPSEWFQSRTWLECLDL